VTSIDETLKALAEGKIDVPTAGEQIRAALSGGEDVSRPAPEDESYGEVALQRFTDKDDTGYEESFNKVTAAWVGGQISDGQYHTIREAALPNGGKQESPQQTQQEKPVEKDQPEQKD